jgi:hypothetical protein
MKNFLAIYLGSESDEAFAKWEALDEATRASREKAGMSGWSQWGANHKDVIADGGGPIGKTKRIDASGISDTENRIVAYSIVQAESHEAAAKLFLNHPHFMIFPGDAVEVMECLPIPGRN